MAAFANMQQANAEKARQLTQLRNQVSDLEHTARRREEEMGATIHTGQGNGCVLVVRGNTKNGCERQWNAQTKNGYERQWNAQT